MLTEKRYVVVGKKQVKSRITGKMTEVDDTQEREVPVQYWEARGKLALQLTANDASGVLVDSFKTRGGDYSRRVETAVNGVSKTNESLPTLDTVKTELIAKVAGEVQQRYTKTYQKVGVRLTVDDPLRPGNAMAMSGQWKEALAAWSGAAMRRNPGDRAYNMAVAQEALAYQAYDASRNPDDAAEAFQQAETLYAEALRSDPGEKFFRQAQERCAGMKANFARAKAQWEAQERIALIELANAEKRQKEEEARRLLDQEQQRELESQRPDTQDETDFRAIVSGRLKSLAGDLDPDAQGKILQLGKSGYNLTEIAANRVMHQEHKRVKEMRNNLELYKGSFADMVVGDKTLDKEERAKLTGLAQRLKLTPDDVRPIETQFQYKDLASPPPSVQPKPPAQPKPPTGVKPVPMAKPAPVKPSVTTPAAPKPVPPPSTPATKK